MKHLSLSLVLPALALAAAAAAQGTLPVDPLVTIGRLDNGLTYYIRENRSPEERAELWLVVNAGAALEDPDQHGAAHFVEHMAFNGTARFPGRMMVDTLEKIGVRFGVDLQAYTGYDETVYRLVVPTDGTAPLAVGLGVVREWAQGVTFDTAAIRMERGVLLEEWRLAQGAAFRVQRRVLPVVFQGSPYANRLPIGTKHGLETVSTRALRRFYDDWYRPNLMAVIAVGDFDGRHLERLIRAHFERIPARSDPRPRPETGLPRRDSVEVVVAMDAEATGTRVKLLSPRPKRARGTVVAHRQELVARLYSELLNDRFNELAQRPDPPFVSAEGTVGEVVRGTEVFSLTAVVSDTGVGHGLRAMLTEVERIARHGFGHTELERARRRVLRGFEHAHAERETTPSHHHAAEYIRHFLARTPIVGKARELELAQRLLPGIGTDETSRVGRDWLAMNRRVIVVEGPVRSEVEKPSGDALLTLWDDVGQAEIAPYHDSVDRGPLLGVDLSEAAIVAETHDATFGVTTWTLANGVRVILKPTNFRTDQVLISAYSPGGSSLVPDSLFTAARLAAAAVRAGGLGRFSAVELRKKLAGSVVRLEPYIDMGQEGLTGEVSPEDLTTLLELVYLHFTSPRADAAAFAALRSHLRTSLAHRDASPSAAFQDTLAAILGGRHPRSGPLTMEAADHVDFGRALAVFRDRFADASDFTFVLVGNFTLDAVRPLVRRYLGNLPALHRTEAPRDLGIRTPAGRVERTVERGLEPQSRTHLVFTGPLDDTPAERFSLATLADVLALRLRRELREERGGTYDVNVTASASRMPRPHYRMDIAFGSAPERTDELVRTLFAEIDSLRLVGGTAAELTKIKQMARRRRAVELRDNQFWIEQLANADRSGEPLGDLLDLGHWLDGLTRESLRWAAERYLDRQRYVRATLLTEAPNTSHEAPTKEGNGKRPLP